MDSITIRDAFLPRVVEIGSGVSYRLELLPWSAVVMVWRNGLRGGDNGLSLCVMLPFQWHSTERLRHKNYRNPLGKGSHNALSHRRNRTGVLLKSVIVMPVTVRGYLIQRNSYKRLKSGEYPLRNGVILFLIVADWKLLFMLYLQVMRAGRYWCRDGRSTIKMLIG